MHLLFVPYSTSCSPYFLLIHPSLCFKPGHCSGILIILWADQQISLIYQTIVLVFFVLLFSICVITEASVIQKSCCSADEFPLGSLILFRCCRSRSPAEAETDDWLAATNVQIDRCKLALYSIIITHVIKDYSIHTSTGMPNLSLGYFLLKKYNL